MGCYVWISCSESPEAFRNVEYYRGPAASLTKFIPPEIAS
jgi:hypothetical protein